MKKIIITTKLTESLEDYLEAILELTEVEGHAHTKKIADKLKVRMPSVTVALRQLAARKLITYSVNYPVELTEAGRAEAQRVLGRHKFLKVFFADILGLPPAKASETACRLEHIVDEDIINRFVKLAERLTADGKKLPLAEGPVQGQETVLSQEPVQGQEPGKETAE